MTSGLIQRLSLVVLFVVAAWFAWAHYFIQDDAYISFRYARNFAEGNGLVWFPALREFGYTNFLFTFGIGLLMWGGVSPETAAALISVPAFFAVIGLTAAIAQQLTGRWLVGWLAGLVLATHYTVSSYATGGMETGLQTALILWTFYLALRFEQERQLTLAVWTGISATLALLCRLDSALLLVYAYLYCVACHLRWRGSWAAMAVMKIIPFIAVVGWLTACWMYYGTALPNTFYAKLGVGGEYVPEGWRYLVDYVLAQCCLPVVLLIAALIAGIALWWQKTPSAAMAFYMLGACALWLLYILYMGGDFMEFRMFVPMLPLFYIACFTLIAQALPRYAMIVLSTITLLNIAANIHHANTFKDTELIDSIGRLDSLVRTSQNNWSMTGQSLHDLFYTGTTDDVLIAVHPAGAIPYFSGLPTVDIYGLNDRWVAQHGTPGRRIAGHRRKAPYSYLVERGVNIIVGFPKYYCPDTDSEIPGRYNWMPVLLIPMKSGCYLVANYLTPHPRIDALIKQGTIQVIPTNTPYAPDGNFNLHFPPFK